jgi:hypothetical protein
MIPSLVTTFNFKNLVNPPQVVYSIIILQLRPSEEGMVFYRATFTAAHNKEFPVVSSKGEALCGFFPFRASLAWLVKGRLEKLVSRCMKYAGIVANAQCKE